MYTTVSRVQVVVMDKLDYCATINNLKSLQGLKNFKFVKGDIQCIDLLSHVLEKEDVDTIMHFAAQVCWSSGLAFQSDNMHLPAHLQLC
jgi:dTDP-D-glucose 4,6-dehydratase